MANTLCRQLPPSANGSSGNVIGRGNSSTAAAPAGAARPGASGGGSGGSGSGSKGVVVQTVNDFLLASGLDNVNLFRLLRCVLAALVFSCTHCNAGELVNMLIMNTTWRSHFSGVNGGETPCKRTCFQGPQANKSPVLPKKGLKLKKN